jgi:hypothetical protein
MSNRVVVQGFKVKFPLIFITTVMIKQLCGVINSKKL